MSGPYPMGVKNYKGHLNKNKKNKRIAKQKQKKKQKILTETNF